MRNLNKPEQSAKRMKLTPEEEQAEREHAYSVAKNYADAGDIPHESRMAMVGCIIVQRAAARAESERRIDESRPDLRGALQVIDYKQVAVAVRRWLVFQEDSPTARFIQEAATLCERMAAGELVERGRAVLDDYEQRGHIISPEIRVADITAENERLRQRVAELEARMAKDYLSAREPAKLEGWKLACQEWEPALLKQREMVADLTAENERLCQRVAELEAQLEFETNPRRGAVEHG